VRIWADIIGSLFIEPWTFIASMMGIMYLIAQKRQYLQFCISLSGFFLSFALIPVIITSHSQIHSLADLRFSNYFLPSISILLVAALYSIAHTPRRIKNLLTAIFISFAMITGFYNVYHIKDHYYTNIGSYGHLQPARVEIIKSASGNNGELPELHALYELLESHNISNYFIAHWPSDHSLRWLEKENIRDYLF
jgi:uncharacterized membrane protein YoaK (UPF0700 family)